MARPFISQFLLPLVRGGTLHVGRPLGLRAVAGVARLVIPDPDSDRAPRDDAAAAEIPEVAELGRQRRLVVARLLGEASVPPLDEISLRLGAAVHNLIALGHPELGGPGAEARYERIAEVAAKLASVGSPASEIEAVNRHSLLARLPEIARSDRTVRFWLGRRSFLGRVPPRRITAWPKLRGVTVETVRRSWLREIGVPAVARPAFLALNIASPLGEALDPLRLDPPISWGHILPVLRWPRLCRVVAGQVVELGVEAAGDALADALFRFGSMQDPPGGLSATAEGVEFAIRFLAHTLWLDLLFSGRGQKPARQVVSQGGGLDLAVILVAARRTSRGLVWPPDLPEQGDLGQAFARRLDAMAVKVRTRRSARLDAALALAEFAVSRPTSPDFDPAGLIPQGDHGLGPLG
jgi:hypothetical protein